MKNNITVFAAIILSMNVNAGGYKIGDPVQDFMLKNIDGKMMSMSDFKNVSGFIIIFTCNHCPFSKAYEDRIINLNNKYASKGFPVIAINSNDVNIVPEDSFEKMIERSMDKKFNFPYLHDETQEIARTFGATRTPHVYILQREKNELVVKYIGAIDNNTEDAGQADKKYIEIAINALLQGNQVPVAETKAIGCTIKWKK